MSGAGTSRRATNPPPPYIDVTLLAPTRALALPNTPHDDHIWELELTQGWEPVDDAGGLGERYRASWGSLIELLAVAKALRACRVSGLSIAFDVGGEGRGTQHRGADAFMRWFSHLPSSLMYLRVQGMGPGNWGVATLIAAIKTPQLHGLQVLVLPDAQKGLPFGALGLLLDAIAASNVTISLICTHPVAVHGIPHPTACECLMDPREEGKARRHTVRGQHTAMRGSTRRNSVLTRCVRRVGVRMLVVARILSCARPAGTAPLPSAPPRRSAYRTTTTYAWGTRDVHHTHAATQLPYELVLEIAAHATNAAHWLTRGQMHAVMDLACDPDRFPRVARALATPAAHWSRRRWIVRQEWLAGLGLWWEFGVPAANARWEEVKAAGAGGARFRVGEF